MACWRQALLLFLLVGCATAPKRIPQPSRGLEIVQLAERLLGIPYRYGGTTPRGFDCSGLVFYVHQKLGIAVPRTAREQFRAARKVPPERLQPGDLLFFKLGQGWHVGIYQGDGHFIHAPTSRGRVRREKLNGFWQRRFVGAGRFW